MAKRAKKPRKANAANEGEIPPGATRKALDRPLDPGGGPPGSAAGTRHAADDEGTENETFGRIEMTTTPASPQREERDPLEEGPPFAGQAGGAVGGTPAQLRASEGRAHSSEGEEEVRRDPAPPREVPRIPGSKHTGMKRLTGFTAIEYAEKQGLSLNKHPDSVNGPQKGLNVAEATAIADDDADLIWLDISEEEYYSGTPISYEPGR